MTVCIHVGNCLDVLRAMPESSVHVVVTSPPYWALRDYGIEPQVWGGDATCPHDFSVEVVERDLRLGLGLAASSKSTRGGGHKAAKVGNIVAETGSCRLCGAWRGAFGLEPTYQLYVEHAVIIFREVRRVLRDDGVLWLNLGDCYASGGSTGEQGRSGEHAYTQKYLRMNRGGRSNPDHAGKNRMRKGLSTSSTQGNGYLDGGPQPYAEVPWVAEAPNRIPQPLLKPKDLIGIPWRVAFALQDDGWYFRQDVVWAKPNPMPESIEDRCTKAHEYLFMLTKRERYYHDAEAIAEEAAYDGGFKSAADFDGKNKDGGVRGHRKVGGSHPRRSVKADGTTENALLIEDRGSKQNNQAVTSHPPVTKRNKRSVWTIATNPFPEAHFATFPAALVEPCVKASTSERGCCPTCGRSWERVCAEVETGSTQKMPDGMATYASGHDAIHRDGREQGATGIPVMTKITLGFYPTCSCYRIDSLPAYLPKPSRAKIGDEAKYKAAMIKWRAACRPVDAIRRALCDAALALPVSRPVVLDPFGGAGTTALVADRFGRDAVLIELNPKYAEMAARRLRDDAQMFADVRVIEGQQEAAE